MVALLLAVTVMLDPGHGGSDGGARGVVAGLLEKQATLDYAKAVRVKLESEGIKVLMTREDDRLLTIRERVRRANAVRPDAFVSIHLNASPDRTQRGFETYVLAREEADREAREIALREGASGGDTAGIVADLRQEVAEARAARLGRAIQDRLAVALGNPFDRGLKQATLDVLKGHTSPAVLVEVGFIDHAEEGVAMAQPDMRERIAQAIAKAIVGSVQKGKR